MYGSNGKSWPRSVLAAKGSNRLGKVWKATKPLNYESLDPVLPRHGEDIANGIAENKKKEDPAGSGRWWMKHPDVDKKEQTIIHFSSRSPRDDLKP